MFLIENAYASSEAVEETNVEATTAEHTTVAPKNEGVAASLGINAQLFGFQLLNFAIVGAIVWFLILKPLTKTMEERKKIIDDSIDNAKAVETNLQMSEVKFQEKLDQAKVEANKIIEKSHTEAEKLSVDMKEKAKKEIEMLVDQAKRNIQIEKESMMTEIKKETVNLIIAAVEKIMNEKLDDKKDVTLIEETIRSFRTE
ncbi:MAG: F0F1 ATP synthase subunit B [Candidatus Magasanikiibacteriota bacterium]